MDTVAHGMWSFLVFFKHRRRRWAFAIGVLPDLITFIPHLFIEHFSGGQALFDTLYRMTHSLVVFALVFAGVALCTRTIPWIAGAWGLHIVFDIFTHPKEYYPTPFLYPFESPFLFALDYRAPWFYAANYVTIAGVFLGLLLINKWFFK